jgi:hypothetical protein
MDTAQVQQESCAPLYIVPNSTNINTGCPEKGHPKLNIMLPQIETIVNK